MYQSSRFLTKPVGNNVFSYREGRELFVGPLKRGSFEDVKISDLIVFEEENDEWLFSCPGLEASIFTEWEGKPVYIFDNHNHALAFWCDAVNKGVLQSGFELVHIDMHSDLWPNEHILDLQRISDESYIERFIDEETNVGNYIAPAIACWLVRKVYRIEWEWDLDRYKDEKISANSVLNLDLDFFAPDLDDIAYEKKKRAILHFAKQSAIITIATSPYFVDQELALEVLRDIFSPKK